MLPKPHIWKLSQFERKRSETELMSPLSILLFINNYNYSSYNISKASNTYSNMTPN